MLGESGYDPVRKAAVLGGALPAAALSAASTDEDRERALAAGFRVLLAKPTEPQALVAAIAELAGRPFATG